MHTNKIEEQELLPAHRLHMQNQNNAIHKNLDVGLVHDRLSMVAALFLSASFLDGDEDFASISANIIVISL